MNSAERILRRVEGNRWIMQADDLAEKHLGFSVFDLPSGDYDEMCKLRDLGWEPRVALEKIHGVTLNI